MKERDVAIAGGVVVTVAAAIRFRLLDVSLFLDEVWTAELIRRGGLHPHSYNIAPLFYGIERLWTAVAGASVAAMREPAAFFGVVACAIPFVAGGDRIRNLVWSLLLAFSSPILFYSGRIKQYTLEAAVVTAMLAVFLRAVESRSRSMWIAFYTVALVAVTTLHGPVFVVCGLAVAAFLHSRRSVIGFALLFGAFAAAYFLYLAPGPETTKLMGDMTEWFAQTGRWVDSPRILFTGTTQWLGEAMNLVRFWWLAVAILGAVWLFTRRNLTLLALALVPPIVIAAASALHLYPYGEVRLMIICFPALYLLIADMVAASANRFALVLLVAVPFVISGIAGDPYNRTYMHCADWRPLFDSVAASRAPGEPIYCDTALAPVLRFYHPETAADLRLPAPANAPGWHVGLRNFDTRGSTAVLRIGDVIAARWK